MGRGSTCALGRLDIRELDALGLDRRPVEVASLPVGNVAPLRVCALREHRLALTIGGGCAGYAERQRQSCQDNVLEERSHIERMLREYTTAALLFMQNTRPTIQGTHICQTWP